VLPSLKTLTNSEDCSKSCVRVGVPAFFPCQWLILSSVIFRLSEQFTGPQAEFLYEIQTKILRVFLLAIHSLVLIFLFLQAHATSYSF
jgi:hypothetical protein